ncbi:hypothetical protein T484DRAFT_1752036 [Baffinella frigidus]|nr:hypothetical protein T484DRAFT_1752036 [Cryptophyta sp. CCMP2293]
MALPDDARSSMVSAPSLLLRCSILAPFCTPEVVPIVGTEFGTDAGGRASPPSDASARSIMRVPELHKANVSTSAHETAVLMFAFVEIRLARPRRGFPALAMASRFQAQSPERPAARRRGRIGSAAAEGLHAARLSRAQRT